MRVSRRQAALLGLWGVTVNGVRSADRPPASLLRINHVPLVVRDLEQAAQTYRRLGFAIKPGRPHADGISNRHIKVPGDGAGIELINAPQITDALTAQYVHMLDQGEGPAYACFVTADMGVLQARMAAQHESYGMDDGLMEPQSAALQWLFVAQGDNLSPTDRPEHFAHANTAYTMLAVWIAGGDQARIRAFFVGLGARIGRRPVFVPDPTVAEVAQLAGGEVIFLPSRRQILPGRLIMGVTMGVRDVAAARRVLAEAGIQSVERPELGYPGILVAPRDTCNVWLELRESQASPEG
jgi:catechol 2,3-dioxygenase-like lactoylglutathione lyase family enzyme